MAAAIVQYLQTLVRQKGSDLHVGAGSPPRVRIRGELLPLQAPPLQAKDMEAMITEILSPSQKDVLTKTRTLDMALKVQGLGVFRVNIFYQRHGLSAVLRALPESPPTIEELRLPPICKTACHHPNGLVLVTGPTGSGKSTSLAAMVNYINTHDKGHILTLEDPVEFQHESKMCMVNQRQLGSHFTSFASALKAALREDPDVILVGEMRDPETIGLAMTAAETGHLVFATLHTNTAAKSVDRIIDSFPADEQPQIRTMLSESLRVVISQKLIPSADRTGRVAVHDIMVNTSAIANLIREGKTYQIPSIMQTARKDGMQMMDQVILEHVRMGNIAGPDAYEYSNDKQMFQQWAPKDAATGATNVTGLSLAAPLAGNLGLKSAQPGTPAVPPVGVKKTGS